MTFGTAEKVIALYEEAKSLRNVHESDWRSAAAYCLPSHYASWNTDGPAAYHQGQSAARRVAYDTTGTRSLPKYVSILERLATPAGQKWHALTASDTSLRKKRRVREYFDQLSSVLFKLRYNPKARFRISTNEVYTSMGVYGNGPLYIGERRVTKHAPVAGIHYVACPLRDCFMLVDDNGELYAFFRRFWLNARQFAVKFPNAKMPQQMEADKANAKGEANYYEFVHYVCPNDDYDEMSLSINRHPYVGVYVDVREKQIVGEPTGYRSMPYKMPRTATVSGDPYGYSPAIQALAALGGASQMKKTYLKQGNKAVDPALAAYDDNVANGQVDQRPGAINYGGVSRDGKLLLQALPTGNFRVAEVLLQDERTDIEDSFFVTLFQILTETPEMTATEVMERVAEKAALLSPTMGRLQSEMLGPMIEREIDRTVELGLMPEMPPELVEAQGEYEVVYTSPLAKSMYAEEVSGFMRSVEMSTNIATVTQDPSPLDHYNFDEAIPEISDYMAVPARWMNTEDKVKKLRADRSAQLEKAQLMQNAGGIASGVKALSDAGAKQ